MKQTVKSAQLDKKTYLFEGKWKNRFCGHKYITTYNFVEQDKQR